MAVKKEKVTTRKGGTYIKEKAEDKSRKAEGKEKKKK